MAEIKRWCRQCGKYQPISMFDQVEDHGRRYCSYECLQDHRDKKAKGRRYS